jgi:hypothetical protein
MKAASHEVLGLAFLEELRPGWDDRKDFLFGVNGLNVHGLFLRRLLEVPLAEGATRAGLVVAFEPQGFLFSLQRDIGFQFPRSEFC